MGKNAIVGQSGGPTSVINASLEKKVPLSWMNANHTQMTEEFLAYARPLIQAELTPLYIAGLPHHIYMKNSK